jgi:hypothetical protein
MECRTSRNTKYVNECTSNRIISLKYQSTIKKYSNCLHNVEQWEDRLFLLHISGLRRESTLEMIPENSPEQTLLPTRLVQLPENLTGCRTQSGEYANKKEECHEKQEFVSALNLHSILSDLRFSRHSTEYNGGTSLPREN